MTDTGAAEAEETQRLLQASVSAFLDRDAPLGRLRALRDTPPGYDRKVWARMAENGWLGLLADEEDGGLGLGFAELKAVVEELGRGLVTEPFGPVAILAAGTLRAAPREVRTELLPALIAGEKLIVPAWQEANGVYGLEEIETSVEEGVSPTISGTKAFVHGAVGADSFLVAARSRDGIGFWEVASANTTITPGRRVDGGVMATVCFENAPASLVVAPKDAAETFDRALDEARLAASIELLGVMEAACASTVDYLKERKQFGKAIGSFQALQHRLVDLWTQKELSRGAVEEAVRVFDETQDLLVRAGAVSAAKARASEAAARITREAIQLYGGMGYTDEADIGLYLKRALVLGAWLGNAAWMRRRYARIVPFE